MSLMVARTTFPGEGDGNTGMVENFSPSSTSQTLEMVREGQSAPTLGSATILRQGIECFSQGPESKYFRLYRLSPSL